MNGHTVGYLAPGADVYPISTTGRAATGSRKAPVKHGDGKREIGRAQLDPLSQLSNRAPACCALQIIGCRKNSNNRTICYVVGVCRL